MNKTKIEWCDYTWNPISGCSPASAGCANCYAAAIAKRFGRNWGQPVFNPMKMDEPTKLKKPSLIFVCSVSDLFHEKVRDEWLFDVFQAMKRAEWHTFILLTKRVERMALAGEALGWPKNAWAGCTVERVDYVGRIGVLKKISAPVHFLSCEPLLGPLDLEAPALDGLEWIIAGPENGRVARPCHEQWIRGMWDDCRRFNVPFFDKREPPLERQWPKIYQQTTEGVRP